MPTTSAPDERPRVAMREEAYGALRAPAALWAGTSVLITNQRGQVLLQRVTHRPTRLLPGGAVDLGESPAPGTARDGRHQLGREAGRAGASRVPTPGSSRRARGTASGRGPVEHHPETVAYRQQRPDQQRPCVGAADTRC
ncbi:NUDIX domain-containing protein [Streptomyces sp. ISL-66]|uniref:NUDIX domain-containing protein n=1 Tax=Streptomyces sp. ISL-66 TaxID=2819186 RepID=UPI001BE5580C|nr:NUDIX domain-containing protein [Streptomyces sp. ISL-66]MBT2472711.1 NUDIX domain-containing protein [Streptomyces sp. ISL-66]